MNKTIGWTLMALGAGWLLALTISGSPGLSMVIAGLLVVLAGSLVLTSEWIPERQSRRLQDRRLASLRGPGTAVRTRDRQLEKRWR